MVKTPKKPKIIRFIGVDPGKNGGLAEISLPGRGIELTPMPETERDIWDWFDMRTPGIPAFAYIESVNLGHPGSSKSVVAKLFGSYARLEMALIASGIPFEPIRPIEWQRGLSIPPRKKSETTNKWKHRLRGKAQQLFPTLAVWNETKGIQLAVCDALLIAEFCRRTWRTK